MNKFFLILAVFLFCSRSLQAQFIPKNLSKEEIEQAHQWVNKTYHSLSEDERLGQLFITALYTNQGSEFIENVRNLVNNEKIGGIILMQDDPIKETELVNEFQSTSKIPLLIGMDAEWGLNQRIPEAHKFPWEITLGAIQNDSLIYEMASKIAQDAKLMGINWVFAPVVDVNTNPANPIIGNRSFGSDVQNVINKGYSYVKGLQDHGILSSIKHFPGHGDTDVDSHLDLPIVSHSIKRLEEVELAPFKALSQKEVAAVMVAHLYVPALEKQKGIPATLSQHIVTDLLQKQLGFKGLIITDALNMGAVAKHYKAGVLDEKAFAAGNDLLLFSQDVATGKKLIQQSIDAGRIPKSQLEKSVKKILLAKYYLGLLDFQKNSTENLVQNLNNSSHIELSKKLYANALTLLKNEKKLLPLQPNETVYYVPLEEAPYQKFSEELSKEVILKIIKPNQISSIPAHSKVIVGFHKDNSTAYKPYKISAASKNILSQLTQNQNVILNVFGSPYALKNVDISKVKTVLISYENNPESLEATAKAFLGKTKIHGRLPVLVNDDLKFGDGIDLNPLH